MNKDNFSVFRLTEDEMSKRLDWYSNKYGPYIERRGLNNWKNLFKKPTMLEWVILFMLLMALFIAWAYNHDVQECRKVLENKNGYACQICSSGVDNTIPNFSLQEINKSYFIVNEEDG